VNSISSERNGPHIDGWMIYFYGENAFHGQECNSNIHIPEPFHS
jgi:hypothetical protein